MVNQKIIKIRKKLDNLDDLLLNIIKKRTILVNQVLKNKKFKKEIIDKKRIKIILKKYNPNTRKHEYFIEKKLPPHSK